MAIELPPPSTYAPMISDGVLLQMAVLETYIEPCEYTPPASVAAGVVAVVVVVLGSNHRYPICGGDGGAS